MVLNIILARKNMLLMEWLNPVCVVPSCVLITISVLFCWYIFNNQHTKENQMGSNTVFNVSKSKQPRRKKAKTSVQKSVFTQPTTSDAGSPTLSFKDNITKPQTGQDLPNQEVNRRRKKRRHEPIVIQESVTFEAIQDTQCIQVLLETYSESEVRRGIQYLSVKGLFRSEAEHIGRAIEHVKQLAERQTSLELSYCLTGLPPDYTESELVDVVTGSGYPEMFGQIPNFKRKYGFMPTPNELIACAEEFPQKRETEGQTFKKLREVLKKKRRKFKELQDTMKKENDAYKRENAMLRQRIMILEREVIRGKCKICHEKEVRAVLRPCGHAFACVTCAERLYGKVRSVHSRKNCAICETKVSSKQQFYLS